MKLCFEFGKKLEGEWKRFTEGIQYDLDHEDIDDPETNWAETHWSVDAIETFRLQKRTKKEGEK